VRGTVFLILSLLSGRIPPSPTLAWTPGQFALATVTAAEIVVDWGQTRDALSRGRRELNPVLGSHPSSARLAVYNAVVIPGMLAVGSFLPERWRTLWFATLFVMQTACVTRNVALGFNVRF